MILDGEYSDGGFGDSIGAGSPYLLPGAGETLRMELLQSGLGNPWPVAYGRHIVGGNVVFQQLNADETTTIFVALGEGEWDALETLWINGAEQTLPNTDLIHFHPGLDGELGTETDPATPNQKICSFYPAIFMPRLTFSRLAYLALNLPPDIEAPDASWDIRGIYRTRKVRTFDASGNQTAYEYSANPAWCILDLLISRWIKPHQTPGESLTAGEKLKIDFATFVAAATYCAADPGDGAARFECHLVFAEKTDLLRALDQMLLICRGYLLEREGKLALFIDQARASELTVTRDMIGADSLYYPRKDLRSLANRLEIRYRHLNSGEGDEAKDFQSVTLEVDDHDHQDETGRVITAEVDLGNTTPGRAMRLGYYLRDRSLVLAEQVHLRILGGAEGSNPVDLLPGDRITAPMDIDGFEPWSYEVLEITDEPDGSREVFAQRYDSSVFQEAQGDPQTIFPTNPGLETGIPGQVRNFAVTGGNGSFIATWDDPLENARTLDDVCIQYATDENFAAVAGTDIGWGKVNRLSSFAPDLTYWFRVAVRNRSLAESNVLVKAAIVATGKTADYGWGPFSNTVGPVYSGTFLTDDDVPEAPDPVTGQFLVEVFRMANGDWKIVFGAEFPTTNNNTADWVQFQISRTPFDPSPDIVYDKIHAVPANDEFITSETHVWYIRARYHNSVDWGDWSVEVVRQEQDFEDGDDTGEPGAVQNLTVKSDDIDTSIPGKELLVQWDTPETNFRSLFGYAVQVHTGASPPSNSVIWSSLVGSGNRGDWFIDDTTANFTAGSHLNKTIWIHSASPMTDANLITTGIVKEIISTTRIRISPFPLDIGGTAIKYQIIEPSWDSATASFDVPVKRKDGFILTEAAYEYLISRLANGSYYVTVWAANKYGQGAKTTVGPYTIDGYKTADYKAGSVTPLVMDGAARAQLGVFMETFEILPDDWRNSAGAGAESLVDGQGQTGGKVYRAAGYRWKIYPSNIPYDSSKLYRIRARLRRTTPGTAGTFYIGVCGYGADGTTKVNAAGADLDSSQHYICAANVSPTSGVWTEYTGWFKGWSASGGSTPSTDPTAPKTLHNDVRYFRPLFIANFSAGTETHDIDYIAIDVQDEEGTNRTYTAINTDGTIKDGKVVTNSLGAGAATSAKVNAAIRGWSHTLVFSAGDQDTVSWGSGGNLILSDGTSYAINGGNTGNMAARTYIYFDGAVSTTVLQLTTTAATAVGDGKILVATAAPGTQEASFFVFSGGAGINVDGANIAARSITANEIAAGVITAYEIAAETITANNLAANSVTATKISAGAIDGQTITGATIKTAASGARVEMTSSGLFGYNASSAETFKVGTDGYAHLFIAKMYAVYNDAATGSLSWDGNVLQISGSLSGLNCDMIQIGSADFVDVNRNVKVLAVYQSDIKVLGAQGAAVADATDAASVIARLNDLLSRLRTHGLIAT